MGSQLNSIKVAPYWNVNLSFSLIALVLILIKVAPYWNVNIEDYSKKEVEILLK